MKSNRPKSNRAAKSFKKAVEGAKPLEKDASYVGELTSGYDATTPGIDGPQKGKDHQEAVNEGGKTDGGAHHDDKRDEVGRAAKSAAMEKLGQALLSLEKEAKDGKLTDLQQSTLADTFKQLGREFDKVLDGAGALEGEYKSDVDILVCSDDKQTKKEASEWISVSASDDDDDEWIDVEATGHPAEDAVDRLHTKFEGRPVDQPSMKAEQWFEPGPGEFEDPRDVAERATAKDTADHTS